MLNRLKFLPLLLILFSLQHAQSPKMRFSTNSVHQFPLTLSGEVVETWKEWDTVGKRIIMRTNSKRIRSSQDLVALEEAEVKAIKRKFGNLSRRMQQRFNSMDESELQETVIILRRPPKMFLDKTKYSLQEQKDATKSNISRVPIVSKEEILKRYNLVDFSKDKNRIYALVPKKLLQKMLFDDDIEEIEERAKHGPLSSNDFIHLAYSSYNPSSGMPLNALGEGVNSATWETGLSNSSVDIHGNPVYRGNFMGCLGNLNASNISSPTTPPWLNWEHSQQTFKCLWQAAPKANLFHRSKGFNSTVDYSNFGDDQFIFDNSLQSISQSISKSAGIDSCWTRIQKSVMIFPYTADYNEFREVDEWAYQYPYPVFSNPAGNWGHQYEVNWQSYNSLSVGLVRHTNLSTYEFMPNNESMSDLCIPGGASTQSRNPKARNGGLDLIPANSVYSYASGDREMPYLVVPGAGPNPGVQMVDNCNPGDMWSGTSYSAPTLNGIATCVISADQRMLSWPEKVRAAILVTAPNVDGGEWNSNVDGRDGVGVVSGSQAVWFAQNHTIPYPISTAVEHGMYTSSLIPADFGTGPIHFNVKIPSQKPAGKHLRIVLTWNSNIHPTLGTNLLSDLDLTFDVHGSASAYSGSYNGNVEVVNIPSSSLTAGATYVAAINKVTNRIPDYQFTYYAIAWTWVKDHANNPG